MTFLINDGQSADTIFDSWSTGKYRRLRYRSNKDRRSQYMMKLQPGETILTGHWIIRDRKAVADSICARIKWLIAHHLQKIADSPQWGAWETLYRDPDDARYWERTYPQGEMHGGGPPQLRCLTTEEAKMKYGVFIF